MLCSYAIAAVVCEQLTFAECQLHKEVIMEVAANAMKDQRPARVAVLYDLEVRAHWANEMAKLGKKFVLSDHVKVFTAAFCSLCLVFCAVSLGSE